MMLLLLLLVMLLVLMLHEELLLLQYRRCRCRCCSRAAAGSRVPPLVVLRRVRQVRLEGDAALAIVEVPTLRPPVRVGLAILR